MLKHAKNVHMAKNWIRTLYFYPISCENDMYDVQYESTFVHPTLNQHQIT